RGCLIAADGAVRDRHVAAGAEDAAALGEAGEPGEPGGAADTVVADGRVRQGEAARGVDAAAERPRGGAAAPPAVRHAVGRRGGVAGDDAVGAGDGRAAAEVVRLAHAVAAEEKGAGRDLDAAPGRPGARLARARDRLRARAGDAAGDRHAADRDGRLARGAE